MNEPTPPPADPRTLLPSTDWSRTPLGPLESWPKALRGYAEMVMAMPSPAIIFWGPDQTQIYNAGYAVILGPRRHPRYFGAPYRESWPDTYPLIYPWMRHVLDEGGTWTVERQHIPVTRHGFDEEAYFTFTFSPLRDDDGRIAGILQPVFDVSESVYAERRAETLRLLVPERQSVASPIDDALAAIAGNAADLPLARAWRWDAGAGRLAEAGATGEALAPTDAARLSAAARDTCEDGVAWLVEDLAAAGAADLATRALVLPLEGAPGGAPLGAIALGISRRQHFDDKYRRFLEMVAGQVAAGMQRAEAALAAERQQRHLDELFMQMPAGIAVLGGPDHVYQLANPAYQAFVGHRELLGRRFIDALPELRGQRFPEYMAAAFRTGEPYVGTEVPAELRRGQDGRTEQTFFNVIYQPLRDERGTVTGILDFAYEVTGQVKARRDAEHLADELRAEHRRKDDFLAMLGHELRNPLAPIAAAAEVLRLSAAADARLRRTTEIVGRQVRHMAALLDDLLDASRVTRGVVTLVRAEEDLRDIVAAAVEQVAPQLEARRHRLRVSTPDVGVPVSGDRKRLVQSLANLLDNAGKYTPEGGLVEVTLALVGREAVLSVRDDGPGVAPALRERIFDLFVQGHRSADRAQGGLGIGLALARQLVELHGGSLACAPVEPGQGSEFVIRLPLSAASAAAATDAPVVAGATTSPGALAILVVDDNEDAAHMLAMLLTGQGHAVATENDPLAALARAQILRPDVCLLDIGLPRMDGNELARRLRATPEAGGAVLVALTGYDQASDREKAAQAGFDHNLVKPPDPEALRQLLGTVAPRAA